MLDMLLRCGAREKTDFVFFDTGLEYRATLEHLNDLEKKYNIKIIRVKPIKSIATCVRDYGVPFRSKDFSKKIRAAQSHGFQWEDGSLEELQCRYENMNTVLKWWCNFDGGFKSFMINSAPFLKEFMMENPPDFKISDKCCTYTKKLPSAHFEKRGKYDLKCTGVRKSEGGVRSTAYKTCFSEGNGMDHFRPVWWLRDSDKDEYCLHYGITHSRCYTEYGLKRTGCVGCPFNKDVINDLEKIKDYEPIVYKAAMHVFGKSYDYTRRYLDYRREKKEANEKG